MIFNAVLSNKAHPEYGTATISFPIPDDQYDDAIELLNGLDIGDASSQDCRVDEIPIGMPVLNRLVAQSVNVDELDYLAKRLDSVDCGDDHQFQAMASLLGLSDVKDLINLTFCCQQATVIHDFSDLERVGKDHRMNLNAGFVGTEEYRALDGQSIALDLIQSGAGVVTPYGVAYDNGMKLEPIYDGRHLPEYYYDAFVAVVTMTPIGRPQDQEFLYLPCPSSKIDRAVQRLGAEKPYQCRAELDPGELSDAVRSLFEEEFELNEHLDALNRLARCHQVFESGQMEKLQTILDAARPQTPEEAAALAENCLSFTVVEGVGTAEEYGRLIAQEMQADAEALEPLELRRLGQRRIDEEGGVFGDRGYVAYTGSRPEILEIMVRHIPSSQEMGGMA